MGEVWRTRCGSWAIAVAALALGAPTLAGQEPPPDPGALALRLAFETEGLDAWSGVGELDRDVVRGGQGALRIVRTARSPGQTGVATTVVPRVFDGETVEVRGWIRTEGLSGWAGVWIRQDGPSGYINLDNMAGRGISGTSEWTQVSARVPLDPGGRSFAIGVIVVGEGTAWADDLELRVDDGPWEEAPAFVPEPDPVLLDTEFDEGSGIALTRVDPRQADDLALLGRVWGFVKYHHPTVTGGESNWDYELFRILPGVLDSPDRETTLSRIDGWLERLGDPPPCDRCVAAASDGVHLAAPIGWIEDEALLGTALSARLQRIHARRSPEPEQRFVHHTPGVRNPDFGGESAYASMPDPDAGYRLLALFRFWNIVEYWFPYRHQIDHPWPTVLRDFVPAVLAAEEGREYRREMLRLIATITDTHANLWSDPGVRPPTGSGQLPVSIRFVEGEAVVTGYLHDDAGPASGLLPGDVIERLDGEPVAELVERWTPWYAASNPPTRLRDMARQLTRGDGPVRVEGRRGSESFEVTVERLPLPDLDFRRMATHDLPGEAFRMLSPEVAYLKLSAVEAGRAREYVERAADATVFVIDIRNYPSEFVPFALGGHFVTDPTPFATFTSAEAANPGAFAFRSGPVSISPLQPHRAGAVAVLVDEVSQSSAEYTAMAFRAGVNTLVVGSTTAGADGNVSPIPLPGGLRGMISGIGVFYPDRTPTQRIGIVPDLVVRPTIAGIRDGRDEVLEAAVSHLLGRPWRLER